MKRLMQILRYIIALLIVFNIFQAFTFKAHFPDGNKLASQAQHYDKFLDDAHAHHSLPTHNGSDATYKIRFRSPLQHNSSRTIERTGIITFRPNAKGTILICHGYSLSKYELIFLRLFFPEYNFMTFDFRAHGENKRGQKCTFGKYESCDVIAAARYIKNHPEMKNKPLYGLGFSMGAASLIEAQGRTPIFDALILDGPYDSTRTVINAGIKRCSINLLGREYKLPFRKVILQHAFDSYIKPILHWAFRKSGIDPHGINSTIEKVDPIASAQNINVPCFFIHCVNDTVIPPKASKKLYNAVLGYKRLWFTSGRGHCDSYFFNPETYIAKVKKFLSTIHTGRYACKKQHKITHIA